MCAVSDGLAWHKIDLHVHTPASKDYRDAGVTADNLVQRAVSVGLDAIAVTDHNTGVLCDAVQAAAKGSGLTVFPGVEISVLAGQTSIHVLAVFDPARGTTHVNDLLAKIGITEDKRGRTESLAEGDINQVITAIHEHGALPLLAHADSSNGALNDMRGQGRISVVQNPRVMGAQITSAGTERFLDGSDPAYNRRLATFHASDAHDLTAIGATYSCFKLERLTVDGLRQCFTDPETRIKHEDFTEATYPAIRSVEVTGGFFSGQRAVFHAGLNSIIGGKGVGKSLLVELIRFALNQPSDVEGVRDDMDGKLEKRLGRGGEVRVRVALPSGDELDVRRAFDGLDNPITVTDVATDRALDAHVAKVFPVTAYSQGEIIDISRDGTAQLKLIDRMVDSDAIHREIQEVRTKLRATSRRFLDCSTAREKLAQIDTDIGTLENRVAELDKALSAPQFAEKKLWDERHLAMDAVSEYGQAAVRGSVAFLETAAQVKLEPMLPSATGDARVVAYRDDVLAAIDRFHEDVRDATDELSASLLKAEAVRAEWTTAAALFHQQFDTFLKGLGGQGDKVLDQLRTSALAELAGLRVRREALARQASAFESTAQERETLLDQLDATRSRLHDARVEVYERLTTSSAGKLRLTVRPDANRAPFVAAIAALVQGLGTHSRNISAIAAACTPRQFVDALRARNTEALRGWGGLSAEMAIKIVDGVNADDGRREALQSLAIDPLVEDDPAIEFRKDDGEYYPLDELSVGQKCTALLLVALSEGRCPVIVDQPEDALDIATIYLDIVHSLRSEKNSRQFILSTHNSNIAVAADSDKFHVLQGTALSGDIVCCGSLDTDAVRRAVVEHLEGGNESYRLRGIKYQMNS